MNTVIRFTRYLVLIFILPTLVSSAFAQSYKIRETKSSEYGNFSSFSVPSEKKITDRHLLLTEASFHHHPDFGAVYLNTLEGAVELLEKRTETTCTFVNPDGSYSQQVLGGIKHYQNGQGYWVLPTKDLVPNNGLWVANNQKNPKALFPDASSSISKRGETFISNKSVKVNGVSGNFSQYQVGAEGMYISDAWTNIDRLVKFDYDLIEGAFVVKAPIATSGNYTVFEETLHLPTGFTIERDTRNGHSVNGYWQGQLLVKDAQGKMAYYYLPAEVFDGHSDKAQKKMTTALYDFVQIGNDVQLKVLLPNSFWNTPNLTYPVFVDPTVIDGDLTTGVPTCYTATAYSSGPTTPSTLPGGSCSGIPSDVLASPESAFYLHNLTAVIPPACNIRTMQIEFTHYGTTGVNWASDMYTYFKYSFASTTCGATGCPTNQLTTTSTGCFYTAGDPYDNLTPWGPNTMNATVPSCCSRTGCAGINVGLDWYLGRNFTSSSGCTTGTHYGVCRLTVTYDVISATTITYTAPASPTGTTCGNSESIQGTITNLVDYCQPTVSVALTGGSATTPVVSPAAGCGINSYNFSYTLSPSILPVCNQSSASFTTDVSGNSTTGAGCGIVSSLSNTRLFRPIYTVQLTGDGLCTQSANLIGGDGTTVCSVLATATSTPGACPAGGDGAPASSPYSFVAFSGQACQQTFSGTVNATGCPGPQTFNPAFPAPSYMCAGGAAVNLGFPSNGGSNGVVGGTGAAYVTGSGPAAVFTPTAAGCFTVSYDAPTGGAFCPATATQNVLVFPQPVINTVTSTCAGNVTVSMASLPPTGFSWRYSLDGAAPVAVPSFSGVAAGPHTITVIPRYNSGTCGSNILGTACQTAPYNFTVYRVPTITLGASPTVCQGVNRVDLPYTATTNSPTTYSIVATAPLMPGFVTVSGAALPVSPISINIPASGVPPGTYNFNLTVRNPGGCNSAAVPFTITISAGSSPGTPTSPNIACNNSAVAIDLYSLLTGESAGGTWTPGGAYTGFNAALGTFVPNGNAPGLYSFSYSVISGTCGVISSTVDITVSAPVTAGTANAPSTVCGSSSAIINLANEITGESAGGTWTAGGAYVGFNASTGEFIPNGNSAGTYTFTYTLAATGCPGDAETVTINLSAPVSAGTATNTAACNNSSIPLDMYAQLAGETGGGSWTTTAPFGFTAGTGAFNPSGVPFGTYTFTYTVPASGACPSDNETVSVTVVPQTTLQMYPSFAANCAAPPILGQVINGANACVPSTTGINGCAMDFNLMPVFYVVNCNGTGVMEVDIDNTSVSAGITMIQAAVYGPIPSSCPSFPVAGASFVSCDMVDPSIGSDLAISANITTPGYYAVIVDTDLPGTFTLDIGGTALPIEISSFSGYAQNQKHILEWTTATEINSKSFVVERYGEDEILNEIGTVAAAGNSNQTRSYQLIDEHPLLGMNKYRLRGEDLDGSLHYSEYVELFFSPQFHYAIFPNPASSQVQIQLSAEAQPVIFELYDATGKKVLSQEWEIRGNEEKTISLLDLSSGLYFYQLKSAGQKYNGKLIKQ